MSRIGREPITLPAGVSATVEDNVITIKGPKGELSQKMDSQLSVEVKDNVLHVKRANDTDDLKAKHGLTRAIVMDMVIGVTEGYAKTLLVKGVGWKVNKQGKKIVMNIGFSHPVEFEEGKGCTFECPDLTTIVVKGIDKFAVGQVAADIRTLRKPEPYHGYGIRYKDEVVAHKEGKTAAASK